MGPRAVAGRETSSSAASARLATAAESALRTTRMSCGCPKTGTITDSNTFTSSGPALHHLVPVIAVAKSGSAASLKGYCRAPRRFFPAQSELVNGVRFLVPIRLQQRRLFSTEWPRESVTNRKRARRRNKVRDRTKSNATKRGLTKRERIMAAVSKRHEPDHFYGVNVPALQSLVQTKLRSVRSYAKELVYERSSLAKRSRYGPNMDTKWWSVNLIICLLPSMLVAGYCEWKRPEMKAFLAEMDEREKKRIWGDDFKGSEENGGEGVEVDEDPNGKLPLVVKLKEAVMALLGYGPAHQDEEAVVTIEGEDSVIAEKVRSGGDVERAGAAAEFDSHVSSSTGTGGVGRFDEVSPTASAACPTRHSSPTVSPALGAATSLEDLLQRIESLERRLDGKNSHHNTNDDVASATGNVAEDQLRRQQERHRQKLEHARQYALQRATAQSGIQNRVDDALIARWEEEEEEKRLMQQGRESEGVPEKVSMTRFAAEAIKAMVFDYQEEVVSAARDYIFRLTRSVADQGGAEDDKDIPSLDPDSSPSPVPSPSSEIDAAVVAISRASASAALATEMAGHAVEAAPSSSPEAAAACARKTSDEASSTATAVSSMAAALNNAHKQDHASAGEQTARSRWPEWLWACGRAWILRHGEAQGNSNVQDVEGGSEVEKERTSTPD